jgi:hypothetical protein
MWVAIFIILWQTGRLLPITGTIPIVNLFTMVLITRGVCLFLLLPALREIAELKVKPSTLLWAAVISVGVFGITAIMSRATYDSFDGLLVYNTIALLAAASCLGIWLSTEIQKPGHLLPLCLIAAGVDYLSVAYGPSSVVLSQLEEHADAVSAGIPHYAPLTSYLILRYPQIGSGLDMMIGVGDLAFFALLAGAVVKFGLTRFNIPLLALWGFAASAYSIVLQSGIPALPFIGIGFILTNVRSMKLDRTEWLITLAFVVALIITGVILRLIR